MLRYIINITNLRGTPDASFYYTYLSILFESPLKKESNKISNLDFWISQTGGKYPCTRASSW